MKNKILTNSIKIFLSMCVVGSIGLQSLKADSTDPKYGSIGTEQKGSFEFPIRPGTPAWEAFESHDEMLAATQIPEEKLKAMSTKELARVMATYPLLIDMFAYNSMQEGFENVAQMSNGLSELLSRSDAADIIFKGYKELRNKTQQTALSNDTAYGAWMLSTAMHEAMLAKPEIANKLTKSQHAQLTTILDSIWNASDMNVASIDNETSTRAPMIFGTTEFLVEKYESQISALRLDHPGILGPGSPDIRTANVKTPKGGSVLVAVKKEASLQERQASDQQYKRTYPQAKLIASATNSYNCHSFAWYMQSTANPYWMNDPSKYWTDGSYMLLMSGTPPSGAKVIFTDTNNKPIHSLVYLGSQLLPMLSKWGGAGLFQHAPNYHPYIVKGTYAFKLK